jgi:hypothetical protein
MARILFQIVLPLLLPFAIYAGWLALRQRRIARAGDDSVPGWAEAPWAWLVVVGALLALLASAGMALYGGSEPGVYVPPRVGPDGQIIPGHVEPRRP